MKNYYTWTQKEVIHCPDKNCKGMLLTHDLYTEHKCSDCGKYWISKVEWVEIKKKGRPA